MATNANAKLGAALAKAAAAPATRVTNTKAQLGQLGPAVGQTIGANGQMVNMYVDPATGEFVDENGLQLTNGSGDFSKPISPNAQSAHVARSPEVLLSNEWTNQADILEKRDAAIAAGKDPHVELTPAEQKAIGASYSDNYILPGVSYVSGNDRAYIDDQKGQKLGTAEGRVDANPAPGTNALGSPTTQAMAGGGFGAAPGAAPAGGAGGSNNILDYLRGKDAQTQNYINQNVTPALQNQQSWLPSYVGGLANLNQQEAADAQGFTDRNNALIPRSQQNTSDANAQLGAYNQNLQAAMNGYNAQDQQTLGNLASTYGSIANPLSAKGWSGDVVSQAAGAHANLGDIQNQGQALAGLQSMANVSLDSKAGQARANESDILNQMQALQDLRGIGNTNLSSEARGASADADALAAQKSALAQYGNLTTPTNTAAERFILEQNRMNQEQGEKASRDAIIRERQMRGTSGSGDTFAAQLLGGQQLSQNRMLGDLGAQAQAVNRSMQALQGYAGLGSTIADQSFQRDFNTRNAADQMSQYNQSNKLAATAQGSDLATAMRNAGFDERYKAGSADDAMLQAQTQARLSALNSAGGLSTSMRNAGFNEDFSRGSAADAVSQFNKDQSMAQQRFQDEYAQKERDAQAQRASTLANTNLVGTGQMSGRADTQYKAGTDTTNSIYNNNNSQLNAEGKINQSNLGATTAARGAQANNLNSAWAMGNQVTGNALNGAQVYYGGLNQNNGAVTGAMQAANAQAQLEELLKKQNEQAKVASPTNKGLFDWI